MFTGLGLGTGLTSPPTSGSDAFLGINVSKFVAETVAEPGILKPGAWSRHGRIFKGLGIVLMPLHINRMFL